jgi:rSAM/selenodomain-associated transferase 1
MKLPIVTLYTKPGCHLCDDARSVIDRVRQCLPFELLVRNILDDPRDLAEFQYAIPVVCVNGREIARYRLDESRLQSALAGCGIVVMAKFPRSGNVKTRLCPALSPEQAARMHGCFLRHVVRRLTRAHEPVTVFVDPPDAAPAASAMLGLHPGGIRPQVDRDLGGRLVAAASDAGFQRLLFLGVDSPDVPQACLNSAIRMLESSDLVIGPAEDGGFWCLGLSPAVDPRALLGGIDWSSGREANQLLARAASLGYNVSQADRWDDVDRPDDLRRLIARLKASTDRDDRRLLARLSFLPHEVLSP